MQRTASQTVGPFFLEALIHAGDAIIKKPGTAGESISIAGGVFDGGGNPVADAFLEVYQADSSGRYIADSREARAGTCFSGFGRAATDEFGQFRFDTIPPGGIQRDQGAAEAPHLDVMVFARGLLKPLVTRIYFQGHAANATDSVLLQVPPNRRNTLEARRVQNAETVIWQFDVRLQGIDETVFFDF